MGWLFAIGVLIAVIAFPRFRKAVLALVGVGAIALFIIYQQSEREQAAAKSRVKPQEVEFTDMRLGRSQYGSSYQLTGRVRNLSTTYSISSLTLRIVLRDCITPQDCSTVGDRNEYVIVSVPPGQTRGVDELVYFSDVPAFRGSFAWSYSVTEIKAK